MKKYDICIVGSGAGAGPIAYELSKAGYSVLILEKGPWIKTAQFNKDEIVAARRSVYTPNLKDEQHVIESKNSKGEWVAKSTYSTGRDFWNGNCVGGSSNFMSGYFHRMKAQDFRLLSEYGAIEGANIEDWPISYEDMEPYFTKVEEVVGVSGRVARHSTQEARSKAFPYPPLAENIVSSWIDKASDNLGYTMVPVPRAILSRPKDKRNPCVYSNYCGSYGCSSDAKGSSRASLLNDALATGNCTIMAHSKVFHLETNGNNKIIKAHFYDKEVQKQSIEANLFVVAAQAIETSRLLLMSKNKEFPNGLGNNNGQVGKNLIFSAGGTGYGHFYYKDLANEDVQKLKIPGLFVNRSIHHWYEIDDKENFPEKIKGGMVDFLFEHPNAIKKAIKQKWDSEGNLVYGSALKSKMHNYFTQQRRLNFEIFCDWLPTDNCFVTLDDKVTDKWGDPVARIRVGYHQHDLEVGKFLAQKSVELLEELGAKDIKSSVSGSPPPNLVAGGCRFGDNPKTSVLDKNCKAHEVDNLFVTDASFMPTGGSVTYTWTIYANAFRVADKIIEKLKNN